MSKKTSLHFFSIALLVSSIILGGSLVYSTMYGSGKTSVATVTDAQNNTYVVEKEEPLKLTVITDSTCEACSSKIFEKVLRQQTGLPLAVRRLEFDSEEAKAILTSNNADFLPYLLLGHEVKKQSNFTHLNHHLISETKDGYFLDLVKMGAPVGRYLDASYYSKDDPLAPKITAKVNEFDFGDVTLSDGKISTEFIIKNEGGSPLEFLSANTSCGCTSAQIVLPDKTSPVYMMAGHQEPVKWRGILASGQEGKVVVYYDPSVHPDLNGAVTREVTIETNDPNSPQLKFKIQVNQILK